MTRQKYTCLIVLRRAPNSPWASRVETHDIRRAVAGACARNRLAVLVPCHRIIRGDGAPGGYRWGLPRKRVLLEREAGAG